MRYFLKLNEGVPTMPVLAHLARNGSRLWNADKLRTTFEGTPHADVDDILLRFGKADGNDLEAIDRSAIKEIPGIKDMALGLMQALRGSRLGRVVITRLAPGKRILPHADVVGDYASYYSRYHVVLQGLPGSMFVCGDETVQMLTGEVWWFDANMEHEVINNSKDDRIHMLVDIRIDP